MASTFFDRFPRFYESSTTGPSKGRLNLRYEAIFAQNHDLIKDARVLDIASHDGRWSFAALQAGAAEVVGIEARESLVAEARENFQHYGIEPDRYRFVAGDVFEVLGTEKFDVDVVLCLGFFYHTLRYPELLSLIHDLQPRHLIVDTGVEPSTDRIVHVVAETFDRDGRAVADRYSRGERVLSGRPSVPALRAMLRTYGFRNHRFSDWSALLRDNPDAGGVGDYATSGRITLTSRFRGTP